MTTQALLPAYLPARYAWYAVTILLLAITVSFVDRQILSLMVQPVRADLGITDTQISLLHGIAFTLFYVVLGVPLGRLADHGHRQRMIVIGIVVWSLATVACGFADSFATLFAARMMVGVGEAALSPAAFSLIADIFPPERRARAMSIYALGPILGTGLALILGGQAVAATAAPGLYHLPLIGAVQGWQAAFVLVGLPGLVVAALFMPVREPPRRERRSAMAGSGGFLAFARSRAAPLGLVSIGMALGGSVVTFGLGAWLPTTFIRLHDWSAPQIAGAMGVILLLFGVSGAIVGGIFADRLTARGRPDGALTLLILGVGVMVPAIPFIGLGGPWVALAAYAWMNFFQGMGALTMPALQGITPNEYRGQVAAVYLLTVTLIGLGFGPTLVAIVTDQVFADDLAIGRSLALVLTLANVAGLILLLFARRTYGKYAINAQGNRP